MRNAMRHNTQHTAQRIVAHTWFCYNRLNRVVMMLHIIAHKGKTPRGHTAQFRRYMCSLVFGRDYGVLVVSRRGL